MKEGGRRGEGGRERGREGRRGEDRREEEEGSMGGEGRREEENEVRRKDGEKKRDSRQRNNMQCIPTTNRECIRCQYHYTKQTLTMATEPSSADWNVYMIPMFTQKGCT